MVTDILQQHNHYDFSVLHFSADVSRVSYCVHWTANSTIPELNIPSFDQMSKALIPYKMKQVDRSMIASGDEKFSYNVSKRICLTSYK